MTGRSQAQFHARGDGAGVRARHVDVGDARTDDPTLIVDLTPVEGDDSSSGDHPSEELVLTAQGGTTARWRPGERLEQLFERRCAALVEVGLGSHLAVDSGDTELTYTELDGRVAFRLDVSRFGPALLYFVGSIVLGLVVVVAVPRLLHRCIVPGRVYPLYGIRYAVQGAISGLSNSKFQNVLFGDSSYIVGYLRAVGLDLGVVRQTGSNFGVAHSWDSPRLSRVGSGTLVSDGLSFVNLEVSRTSFAVHSVAIGAENFLGNAITYPARGRTGDNCLLATKVMVPVDGALRADVGLLGSPSFEIPRSVLRDSRFDRYRAGALFRSGLARKNRSNLATIALFLATQWFVLYLSVLIGVAMVRLGGALAHVTLAGGHNCTVGPNAFGHYGVQVVHQVVLAADSFLMKGEVTASDESWGGNPARRRG